MHQLQLPYTILYRVREIADRYGLIGTAQLQDLPEHGREDLFMTARLAGGDDVVRMTIEDFDLCEEIQALRFFDEAIDKQIKFLQYLRKTAIGNRLQ